MQNNKVQSVQTYALKITKIINKHNYKRVVLQMSKELLSLSFNLTSRLRKQCEGCQFFVLYDSLKQSCCTDILGAEHVRYDCLVHFGNACFSQEYQHNHYYLFEEPEEDKVAVLNEVLKNEQNIGFLLKNEVGFVVVQQKYYEYVRDHIFKNFKLGQTDIQLLKLPFDRQEKDEYIAFGSYGKIKTPKQNILVIDDTTTQEAMTLKQKFAFSIKGLSDKIGQKLFSLNFNTKSIETLSINQNKLLMQRYSLISQLDNHKVFGLIASNTSTKFHHQVLEYCKTILKNNDKKTFTFMMNNLNQVKLGNFPQIQVYVIVSCFNHSLFGIKDFHRIVVTPNDLWIAFGGRKFEEYIFDNNAEKIEITAEKQMQKQMKKPLKDEPGQQLQKLQHNELALQDKIQTLDFYRQRQFKGLQFAQKKQIKKMTKGKIGLAEEYKPLE